MNQAYKVQVIVVDKVSQYHVVCVHTKLSHSVWRSYDAAMTTLRDLNTMLRKANRRWAA